MPHIEDTVWKPNKRQIRYRVSIALLQSVKIGETKRIIHDDVFCNYCTATKNKSCSLLTELYRLRYKEGWLIESYHESDHVIVVNRLDPNLYPNYKETRKRYGRPKIIRETDKYDKFEID